MSDLHAANAQYHQDCKTKFLHSRYLDRLSISLKEEKDYALPCVIKHMKENDKQLWNSVEIHNIYTENGGYKLSRRSLVNAFCDHFSDLLLVLSSPGVASIY